MPVRLFFLAVLLFVLPQLTIAQKSEDIDWQEGWIEFNDGRRQACELSFNSSTAEGAVLMRKGNKVIAYPPAKVAAFSFAGREFVSLPIHHPIQKIKKDFFLELLFEGELISLFDFEVEVLGDFKPKTHSFLLLLNMETGILDRYNKDFLLELMDNRRKMKKYIRSNSLSFKDSNDIISILAKYHKEKNKGFYTPGQAVAP